MGKKLTNAHKTDFYRLFLLNFGHHVFALREVEN